MFLNQTIITEVIRSRFKLQRIRYHSNHYVDISVCIIWCQYVYHFDLLHVVFIKKYIKNIYFQTDIKQFRT